MIETDAPFLTPRNMSERPVENRNESKYLPHILETIADILDKDIEDLADEIYETTCRFFRIK